MHDEGVKQGLVIHHKSSATLEGDWLGLKQPSKLLIGMYGIDTMEIDIIYRWQLYYEVVP